MDIILAIMPWSIIRQVAVAVIKLIIADSDNKYDDELLNTVENIIDGAELDSPDEESRDGVVDFVIGMFDSDRD